MLYPHETRSRSVPRYQRRAETKNIGYTRNEPLGTPQGKYFPKIPRRIQVRFIIHCLDRHRAGFVTAFASGRTLYTCAPQHRDDRARLSPGPPGSNLLPRGESGEVDAPRPLERHRDKLQWRNLGFYHNRHLREEGGRTLGLDERVWTRSRGDVGGFGVFFGPVLIGQQ